MAESNVLIVDDDPEILKGYKRLLLGHFKVTVSDDPIGMLHHLTNTDDNYAVIISDYRMPQLNGVQFLTKIKDLRPDTVRIILTGNADLEVAIEAINQGDVFRFLRKPCGEKIIDTINAGIQQYRLITSEKILQEKTLKGTIKLLVDILSAYNAKAFEIAQKARLFVRKLTKKLNIKNAWEFELSVLLSQIGIITIPKTIEEKYYSNLNLTAYEKEIFQTHTEMAFKLISNIPRLETIAKAISLYLKDYKDLRELKNKRVVQMASMLRFSLDYMRLHEFLPTEENLITMMLDRRLMYDPDIFAAFIETIATEKDEQIIKTLSPNDLLSGMILAHDIKDTNGALIVPGGTQLSDILILKLRNLKKQNKSLGKIDVYTLKKHKLKNIDTP